MTEKIFSNIGIPSYIFLGLFILVSIAQIILGFLEKEKARIIVKPFCMTFLGLFAAFTYPSGYFIYIGCFLDVIGDILVVILDRKYFALGAGFFFLGFLSYLFAIFKVIREYWMIYDYPIIIGLFVISLIALFIFLKRYIENDAERVGASIYYSTIVALLTAFILVQIRVGWFFFIGIIGTILFLISDITIFIRRYIKEFKRSNFIIMLTYLLAQLLIVISLVISYICFYL